MRTDILSCIKSRRLAKGSKGRPKERAPACRTGVSQVLAKQDRRASGSVQAFFLFSSFVLCSASVPSWGAFPLVLFQSSSDKATSAAYATLRATFSRSQLSWHRHEWVVHGIQTVVVGEISSHHISCITRGFKQHCFKVMVATVMHLQFQKCSDMFSNSTTNPSGFVHICRPSTLRVVS